MPVDVEQQLAALGKFWNETIVHVETSEIISHDTARRSPSTIGVDGLAAAPTADQPRGIHQFTEEEATMIDLETPSQTDEHRKGSKRVLVAGAPGRRRCGRDRPRGDPQGRTREPRRPTVHDRHRAPNDDTSASAVRRTGRAARAGDVRHRRGRAEYRRRRSTSPSVTGGESTATGAYHGRRLGPTR